MIFRRSRRRSCAAIVLLALLTVMYRHRRQAQEERYPVVVWWSDGFAGYSRKISSCPSGVNCDFIGDRGRHAADARGAEGYLFYGTAFSPHDLPLPRRGPDVVWGLFHEESPRNAPLLSHGPTLRLFNRSATFSRRSHVPLTLQHLDGIGPLLDRSRFVPTALKNRLLGELAPVLFLQSDCDTASHREDYVRELMRHVPVDSYGACLNNRNFSAAERSLGGDYLNRLGDDALLRFVARYKFTVAFENGVCRDYITEKLWRPLAVGSVPLYLGSPSVRDWLPNNDSAIIVGDFDSPEELARHVLRLNARDDLYEEHLRHKTASEISNRRLIERLARRSAPLDVDGLECLVCSTVREPRPRAESVLDETHYECERPRPPLRGVAPNMWTHLWDASKKESEILYRMIADENRRQITKEDFEKRVYGI